VCDRNLTFWPMLMAKLWTFSLIPSRMECGALI
jgi:hypothetical protein